jgi:hypothetical protein
MIGVCVLKHVQLLLRRVLVMLLVFRRGLGAGLDFLTDEEELRVGVVEVLWFDFGPGEAAEFFDKSSKRLLATCQKSGVSLCSLLGEIGTLRQTRVSRPRPCRILDAEDEATLRPQSEIFLHLTQLRRDSDRVHQMRGPVFCTCNSVDALCSSRDWIDLAGTGRLGLIAAALHEVVLQFFDRGRLLLDESHEAVVVGLGEHLLWQCEETVIL